MMPNCEMCFQAKSTTIDDARFDKHTLGKRHLYYASM